MKNIIYIIIVLLFSCSNPKDEYIKKVYYELNILNRQILDDYSYVIIIPGSGCSGCITEAENFYRNHKDNKNIFFIFTDISSIKSIKLKIGKDVIKKSNVYFDMDDTFLSKDYSENIYPLIFNIQDKNNINYHFLSQEEKLDL